MEPKFYDKQSNIYDKQSKGKNRVISFNDRNTTVYFDSFGIKYIVQEVFKIKDKSITHLEYNYIFRIQSHNVILCRFYYISFIKYMTARKTLLDYTNLCSPNDNKKYGKIIYMFFNDKYGKKTQALNLD